MYFMHGVLRLPIMAPGDRFLPAVLREQAESEMEGGAEFHRTGGMPVRWLRARPVRFRCENGHVREKFLKSQSLQRPACWLCSARVWVTWPEDE